MIPKTSFLLIARPTDVTTRGLPWTKFIVPSMGSIIHVGLLVSADKGSFCKQIKLRSTVTSRGKKVLSITVVDCDGD